MIFTQQHKRTCDKLPPRSTIMHEYERSINKSCQYLSESNIPLSIINLVQQDKLAQQKDHM
jgi:hypothetical protein